MCKKRTKEFGIDFEADLISSTTDGAAIMIKYGKLSLILHFTCLAHGIHLAVTDILYKKPKAKQPTDDENGATTEPDATNDDDFNEYEDDVEMVEVRMKMNVDLQIITKKILWLQVRNCEFGVKRSKTH